MHGKKAKIQADLHCHTTASDGLLKPAAVVELAYNRGMKAIGITDHDTIDGWQEAEKAANNFPIKVIRGIEVNTDWQDREIHILGYLMDEESSSFNNQIADLQEKRIVRIKDILNKLELLGMDITFEEVMQYAKGNSIGRPHVAQAIVNKGYVGDFREAFDSYLRVGASAYVPRYKLTPTEAIKLIRNAQGIAVLAHPGVHLSEKEIKQWIEDGLQGIEVYHPEHSCKDSIRYNNLAERLGLIATGGSDFHGMSIKTGIDIGDWGVGLEVIDRLESLKRFANQTNIEE